MKTFDQIAEEVARKKGYDNFNHFDQTFPKSSKEVCKEAAKRYAEQALDEAAKNAKTLKSEVGCSNWCGSDYCSPSCANARTVHSIDKQSILSIKEKL